METVEGTRPALEVGRDEGVARRPLEQHEQPDPAATLADADRHLLVIGAEVVGLREELARLREEAGERADLLAEREVVVAELSSLLPTLEEARVDALRRAESASVALTRAEARVSENGGRIIELQRQLATVASTNAAHERVVVELEARLATERATRDGTERAVGEALAWTRSAERSLAEARARLEDVSGDHGRLLVDGKEEHVVEQQRVEETSAAVRVPESRLSRETQRADALERERETLEAALAQHVAGLSELEAELARARSEREAARAVAYVRLVGDKLLRARELAVVEARLRRLGTPSWLFPPHAAALEASRRLADVFRPGNREPRSIRIRASASALRHPLAALPVHVRAISGVRDGRQSS